MFTALHRKIKSMCKFTRGGTGHWILIGAKTVWVAEIQKIVTTKRAAYAAFLGPVPGGSDLRATCGIGSCICPQHQELVPTRTKSEALFLPKELEALAKPEVFRPRDAENVLPRGVTVYLINLVKFLWKQNNDLAQIKLATGLPFVEIVKIKNGAYNEAVKNLVGASTKKMAEKDLRGLGSHLDIPGGEMPEIAETVRDVPPVPVVPEGTEVTEEEAAWLKQMGIG